MRVLLETAWLHPLLHVVTPLAETLHLLLTPWSLPRFLFLAICQGSFFGVVTSVVKGQGQTAPPQIPPLGAGRAPRSGGQLYSARPRGTLPLGKKTWPELRGRCIEGGVEDVKITASITSCCSTPPPLFRFYELTKRRLRLFS